MRQYKYSMYNQEPKIKNPKRSTDVDGCQKMIKDVDGGKSGKAMPVDEHSNGTGQQHIPNTFFSNLYKQLDVHLYAQVAHQCEKEGEDNDDALEEEEMGEGYLAAKE
ncbi:hypothetical protein M422DRAFT_274657 [Sphaerobolus stellatus SS14]|uniref:Uncharacterized protein n=1 Tax=Sphaerobolus stellatus (strain SS14) TaxID=990650 RepID=A0A0C9U608_SPHS4|nr:hypothetical protein M422DRAFT_274657 [Sphaerobolus stellatus SS14]